VEGEARSWVGDTGDHGVDRGIKICQDELILAVLRIDRAEALHWHHHVTVFRVEHVDVDVKILRVERVLAEVKVQLEVGAKALQVAEPGRSGPGAVGGVLAVFAPGAGEEDPEYFLRIISRRGHIATGSGPVGVEELTPRFIDAFVCVGAEIISLSLEQIGRQTLCAVAVKESQRA
jgi:hypothetical protein